MDRTLLQMHNGLVGDSYHMRWDGAHVSGRGRGYELFRCE